MTSAVGPSGGSSIGPDGSDGGSMAVRARVAWSLVWRAGRAALGGTVVVGALSAAVPLSAAWLMKILLDELSGGRPSRQILVWIGVGLAAGGLLAAVLPHVNRHLEAHLRREIALLSQAELFAAVNRNTGLARFERPEFHDRLRLAREAGQSAAMEIVLPMVSTAQSLLTTIGFVVTLALLNPVLAGVVVLAGAPAVVGELVLGRQRAALMWRISPLGRRQVFYGGLLTDVDAAKEVRLFGLGRFLHDRLLRDLRAANDGERALDRRELAVYGGLNALTALVAGGGLLWVVVDVAAGSLSIGDVAVFVAAVAGTQAGLSGLVSHLGAVYGALLLFGHYRSVVHAGPDLAVAADAAPAPALDHGVELRDVWFRYDEGHPWILRGVDLTLPAGATVALVGANGSGKSTLVKLLCRFYDPQRGAVRWDGHDVRELDPSSLRDRIAAVFQDCVEYDFTAAENIGVGNLAAIGDRERIREAAELAGVDGALARLPRGYDTMLSRLFGPTDDDPGTADAEAGVELSGGQWQRVAVARAFLRGDRDLTILDEPSNGLDADAEHELHTALRKHRAGRTSLLISHRLNTVRDADLIVVLDDGRIVERGTHDDLVAAGGTYARLFEKQAGGYR